LHLNEVFDTSFDFPARFEAPGLNEVFDTSFEISRVEPGPSPRTAVHLAVLRPASPATFCSNEVFDTSSALDGPAGQVRGKARVRPANNRRSFGALRRRGWRADLRPLSG